MFVNKNYQKQIEELDDIPPEKSAEEEYDPDYKDWTDEELS